ncbi:hypothetical protein F0L74_10020 [Chitinophaga agrisoli]|uniref:Uncharacterized protein n=1 Tax=Chitinophaga agrisoli TaxID=2607653 RepID=A0A5B2VUV8_9BACT|nr:hypothetical protein [Chitinophaga agrisoli]KAA2242855.1 hypothetical protein F0L74_10020 [Chitinophaga agrisoli]
MSSYLEYRRALKNGTATPQAKKKPTKIRPFSKKREKINRVYAKKSRPFWKGKDCEIKLPGCTGKAQCINHKKGKATTALLMDERFWEASCFYCNGEIENKNQWAVDNGHKLSRNNKY